MLIHELERQKWDVIGISETHWTGTPDSLVGYKDSKSSAQEEPGSILSVESNQNVESKAKNVESKTTFVYFKKLVF